jgi:hypothetical protein
MCCVDLAVLGDRHTAELLFGRDQLAQGMLARAQSWLDGELQLPTALQLSTL